MDKMSTWLIIILIIFSTCSVYAENNQKLVNPKPSISEIKTRLSNEPTPIVKEQEFYKATVQAYKDFNEQVVSSVKIALVIVSGFVTLLVFLFVFLFRRTLAEIKKDIRDDSDRVSNVYSKTFEMLNAQANFMLKFFENRDVEIKATLQKMQDIVLEIEKQKAYEEGIASRLAEREIIEYTKEKAKNKEEVEKIKKEMESDIR